MIGMKTNHAQLPMYALCLFLSEVLGRPTKILVEYNVLHSGSFLDVPCDSLLVEERIFQSLPFVFLPFI